MIRSHITRTGTTIICMLLCASLMLPVPAAAQSVNTAVCLTETYNALAHEKRLYRSVLFGEKKAEDVPVGSVRFDTEQHSWVKKDASVWNSLAKGFEGNDRYNILMDNMADVPPRRGIFEIRKTPTSDLLPAVIQAFRAYQCRLVAVCDAAKKSQNTQVGKTTLNIQPEGCIEFEEPIFNSCKNNTQITVGTNTCEAVVQSMLDQEEQTLKLLIAYDAAYRTLLQFEGIFEGFLQDFRFPLIEPLWQTVRALGAMTHIPCFTSQCDE